MKKAKRKAVSPHMKSQGSKKARSRFGLYLTLSFWVFLAAVFSAIVIIQLGNASEKEREALALEQELEAEKLEEASLKAQLEFKESSEYAQREAHVRLGWVYPDEIIFYVDD
jgi:cell division protein FtsB